MVDQVLAGDDHGDGGGSGGLKLKLLLLLGVPLGSSGNLSTGISRLFNMSSRGGRMGPGPSRSDAKVVKVLHY